MAFELNVGSSVSAEGKRMRCGTINRRRPPAGKANVGAKAVGGNSVSSGMLSAVVVKPLLVWHVSSAIVPSGPIGLSSPKGSNHVGISPEVTM